MVLLMFLCLSKIFVLVPTKTACILYQLLPNVTYKEISAAFMISDPFYSSSDALLIKFNLAAIAVLSLSNFLTKLLVDSFF